MSEEKTLLKQTLDLHSQLLKLVHATIEGVYDRKLGTVFLKLENSQGKDIEISITSKEIDE